MPNSFTGEESYSRTSSADGTQKGSETQSCGETKSYSNPFHESTTPCETIEYSTIVFRTAKFRIESKDERDKLYAILASNGYKVWQENECPYNSLIDSDHWVCVEYASKEKE